MHGLCQQLVTDWHDTVISRYCDGIVTELHKLPPSSLAMLSQDWYTEHHQAVHDSSQTDKS